MDDEKEEFVVFILERDEDANAYIWVRINEGFNADRDIRVTNYFGLCTYCNQSEEPFYIGEIPQKFVEIALGKIGQCPKDKMKEMLDDFSEDMQTKAKNEKILEEYYKWEEEAINEVEEARSKGEEVYYF